MARLSVLECGQLYTIGCRFKAFCHLREERFHSLPRLPIAQSVYEASFTRNLCRLGLQYGVPRFETEEKHEPPPAHPDLWS